MKTSIFGGTSSAPSRKKKVKIYMLIPLILGFVGIGYGISQIANAIATKSWMPVPAQIVRSGKEWREIGNRDGGSSRLASERSIEVPVIRYTYAIGARKYESGRIFIGDNHFSEVKNEKADAWVARFPQGAQLTAYVNRYDPSEAVLLTGFHARLWITPVIVGVAFIAVPTGLLLRG